MMLFAFLVAAAFVLGGVLGGDIVGRFKRVNLRAAGSGNIGATNALRTQGVVFALMVLAIDVGKGVLAVWLLPPLAPPSASLPFACGAAAVVGHCFSPWHGFNGGKGVATLAGVFLALMPMVMGWVLLAFALTLLLTGIVSLATLFGGLVAFWVVSCFSANGIFSAAGAFAAAMLLLLLFTHRDNWRRLIQGRELRFEKARLLGRALGLPALGIASQG